MDLTPQEHNFTKIFSEYHREVKDGYEKLERAIKELNGKYELLNTKQTVLENENTRVAIEKLTDLYHSIDKRQSLLERGLDETKQFRERVENDLAAIRAAQLSEDDLKMFRKGKAVFIVMAIIFGLFQIWQVVKDFIKIP